VRKVRYDTFYDTHLDHFLRIWDVDTLVICGTVANICIHYTAASAAMRWYDVVIPRDATSALDPFDLESYLRQVSFLFAGKITESEAIKAGKSDSYKEGQAGGDGRGTGRRSLAEVLGLKWSGGAIPPGQAPSDVLRAGYWPAWRTRTKPPPIRPFDDRCSGEPVIGGSEARQSPNVRGTPPPEPSGGVLSDRASRTNGMREAVCCGRTVG
jgi:Isochorismatase family